MKQLKDPDLDCSQFQISEVAWGESTEKVFISEHLTYPLVTFSTMDVNSSKWTFGKTYEATYVVCKFFGNN